MAHIPLSEYDKLINDLIKNSKATTQSYFTLEQLIKKEVSEVVIPDVAVNSEIFALLVRELMPRLIILGKQHCKDFQVLFKNNKLEFSYTGTSTQRIEFKAEVYISDDAHIVIKSGTNTKKIELADPESLINNVFELNVMSIIIRSAK